MKLFNFLSVKSYSCHVCHITSVLPSSNFVTAIIMFATFSIINVVFIFLYLSFL
nr:MAG TPA: hypothetical protein [Caudoviricetes sp.]